MLNLMNSFMDALFSIENHVLIDMSKAFNNVLLQQKQIIDSNGHPTVTTHYIELYKERILKQLDPTHFVYSPSQKCFVQISKDTVLGYSPEDYINFNGNFNFFVCTV